MCQFLPCQCHLQWELQWDLQWDLQCQGNTQINVEDYGRWRCQRELVVPRWLWKMTLTDPRRLAWQSRRLKLWCVSVSVRIRILVNYHENVGPTESVTDQPTYRWKRPSYRAGRSKNSFQKPVVTDCEVLTRAFLLALWRFNSHFGVSTRVVTFQLAFWRFNFQRNGAVTDLPEKMTTVLPEGGGVVKDHCTGRHQSKLWCFTLGFDFVQRGRWRLKPDRSNVYVSPSFRFFPHPPSPGT